MGFEPSEVLSTLRGAPGPERQGCTAVVCLVVPGQSNREMSEESADSRDIKGDAVEQRDTTKSKARLIVANAGDSRSVFCHGKKVVCMSEDHKPDLPGKLSRITKAGGKVVLVPGGGA